MIATKILLEHMRSVSKKLKSAAVWNGTGFAVDATTDDYVYEMLCYFQIAVWASQAYHVGVAGNVTTPTRGKRIARWPKKPGLKKNFSFLSLRDTTTVVVGAVEVFQLCPGINIQDKDGKDRSPDVNLLAAGAPDRPDASHLHACWDAKHTKRSGTRLPDTAVSDFVFTHQQLGRPVPPPAWRKAVPNKICLQSGLITNGLASTEPAAVFISNGVAETSAFPDSPVTRP